MSCVINKYWHSTYLCEEHGLLIRIYLSSIIGIISVNLILLILIVNQSAKGSIIDENVRWLVAPLLTFKIILILPETILNIFGTIWAFCDSISCRLDADFYSKTVIECKNFIYFVTFLIILKYLVTVILNWIVFGLIIFGKKFVNNFGSNLILKFLFS